MTLPNQAAGLATIGLEFAFSSGDSGVPGVGDSIPGAIDRTQSAITSILKGQMQNSAGWGAAHEAGYGELLPGIPFVPNIIFQMADAIIDMTPLGPFVNLSDITDFISSGASFLGGLIPGLDASKIISGTLGAGIIQPLIDAISQGFGGGDGFDFSDLTDFLAGLVFGGGAVWDELFGGITGQTGGLDELITLFTGGLFGNIDPGRISFVPTGAIGTDSPNLFDNPGFDGGIAFDEAYGWTHDETVGHTNLGSARIAADGTLHTLYSNPIAVDVNQTIPMGAWVRYTGVTATASSNAIQIAVAAYSGTGAGAALISETFFKGVLSPSGSSSNPGENNFIHLEDTYTVPAGVDEIRMVCKILPAATAGVIHFDDGHAQTTRLLPIPFIDGLPTQLSDLVAFGQGIVDKIGNALGHIGSLFDLDDILDWLGPGNIPFGNIAGLFGSNNIGVNIQDFIDMGVQALSGGLGTGYFLADWKQALQFIPGANVLGAGGLPNVVETFTSMWDLVTSGLRLTDLFGVDLPSFANAAQDTSFSSLNGNLLASGHEVTLGVRTNNPITSFERTAVSNFNAQLLGTAATPSNFNITNAASAIAIVRMPNADTKATVFWRSFFTGSVTAFYINFGVLNDDGSVTHLYQTPDIKANLTGTWSWDGYQVPDANKIVHADSVNIVVEFIMVGTGSVTIAGIDNAWLTDSFPGAVTRRTGATRNTASLHPDLTLSAATMNSMYGTKTPWVALGRADVPLNYHPPEAWASTSAGAFTYTIPTWARVAGTIIDYWAIGAGGGGQSGGYFVTAEGGSKGTWIAGGLIYGTDIPLGTTQLTGVVADNASGGINPFALDPGDNGGATTITGIGGGFTTKTAAGGFGGGRAGNNTSNASGQAAGNSPSRGGIVQFGGAAAGVNNDGNRPGGGGGSGYPAVGRQGAEGQVFFRARQP